ncbi:PucR family transcriptional regulator [Zymobacter palmae]|uniref:Regulator of polyketide synthase expression n=1 Tax=Zymobacter palmae TaxID=33074 RepID=A0A348HHN0_9GAMM|nr:PucR family transcriptional regulator ligand-binding domain-containing protein [Zymobacter palmae]BBG31132.1 regulator of polyketide synthase expression [Zymobacter palmae]
MSLTVLNVLELEGLEPMSLRAGLPNVHKSVRWYYVAENEGIAEWIMGGELVFVTGINHPRDESNLLRLLHEGHEKGIAGMVILTGNDFIKIIPASVISLADTLGIPLVEQPYSLKMVLVTQIIGTALVQHCSMRRSQRDILTQMLTGEYPSLDIARQRAEHLQLVLQAPYRIIAMRLAHIQVLFDTLSPDQAETTLQKASLHVRDFLKQSLIYRKEKMPLIELGELFILLLEDRSEGLQQQKQFLHHLQQSAMAEFSPLILRGGMSSPVHSLTQLSQGLMEARRALDIAQAMPAQSGLCDYAEIGVLKLLSAIHDQNLIFQFMKDIIGVLHEPYRKYPFQLIETLEAVLQENGNLIKAAEHLGIHRNTLYQRVQRIEQQTGQSLNDAQFRLNASIALLIFRRWSHHMPVWMSF